ncbi:hypothetical protein FRC02_012184 [Tulasnella sp. 418]|nr:hypothetical protein FRC02_012184 [Tulasnella sp. 418]
MMTLLLIVSIVLSLGLWVRPPDIRFNGIKLPESGSGVTVETDGLHINLELSIGVKNPNFFGAAFRTIEAKAFYPPLQPQLGGGILDNVNFPANSETTFLFPFSIVYTTTIDPTNILMKDLVDKCGIRDPSVTSKLKVKYELSLALRILVATINPSFSGSADFDCPVTREDLIKLGGPDILKTLGVE